MEEVALPAHPRYSDTFNDTSIHWFPAHKLERLSAEVWQFLEEPTYEDCDDLEIIRKGEEGSQHGPAPAQPYLLPLPSVLLHSRGDAQALTVPEVAIPEH